MVFGWRRRHCKACPTRSGCPLTTSTRGGCSMGRPWPLAENPTSVRTFSVRSGRSTRGSIPPNVRSPVRALPRQPETCRQLRDMRPMPSSEPKEMVTFWRRSNGRLNARVATPKSSRGSVSRQAQWTHVAWLSTSMVGHSIRGAPVLNVPHGGMAAATPSPSLLRRQRSRRRLRPTWASSEHTAGNSQRITAPVSWRPTLCWADSDRRST